MLALEWVKVTLGGLSLGIYIQVQKAVEILKMLDEKLVGLGDLKGIISKLLAAKSEHLLPVI